MGHSPAPRPPPDEGLVFGIATAASLVGILCVVWALVQLGPLWVRATSYGPSRTDSTRTRAATIRSAATLFAAGDAGSACPTLADLFAGGYLQSGTDTRDAWGNPYWVDCRGGAITVRSYRYDGWVILQPRHARKWVRDRSGQRARVQRDVVVGLPTRDSGPGAVGTTRLEHRFI